jgi:nitrous oxide reductase accessory protein NosL
MTPLVLTLLIACGGGNHDGEVEVVPEPSADHVCDVCGMFVSGQPAPRGQVLYRDGTHAHACAVGDLRALVQAPSAHGAVIATWVETVPAGFDPAAPAGAPLPWMPADDGWYVVGFARPGTMGRPTLAFATQEAARAAAERVGGRVVRWPALREAPSHRDPG